MHFFEYLARHGQNLATIDASTRQQLYATWQAEYPDIDHDAMSMGARAFRQWGTLTGAKLVADKPSDEEEEPESPPVEDEADEEDDCPCDNRDEDGNCDCPDEEGDDAGDEEVARQKAIRRRGKKASVAVRNPAVLARISETVQSCILTGVSAKAAELAILRASRGVAGSSHINAPVPGSRNHRMEANTAIFEVSMLCHLGMNEQALAKHYSPRVIDQATAREVRGLTLHKLMALSLASRGKRSPIKFGDDSIRQAFGPLAGSGPSTVSVSGILSNVANKLLLSAFENTPQTWREWCNQSSVSNFHVAPRYRVYGLGRLEQTGDGPIPHASLGEESFTNQIDTFARQLGLGRKQLINDDLSAFESVPKILARMAGLTLERAVYTELLSNPGSPAFFSNEHKNYASTGSALASGTLGTAYKNLISQKDANGDPIGVQPSVLLVPPALAVTAEELTVSQGLVGTAGTPVPDSNIWKGKFKAVVGHYLAANGLTGGSDTGWYLLAGPGEISPVDVAFLDGRQTPVVEANQFDFDQLGQSFRCYWDFGVALADYRGGHFSTGQAGG